MTHQGSTDRSWQLEGSSAEAYEALLVPAIFFEMSSGLVEAVSIQSGDRVLDVACGTGVVSRAVATVVGSGGSVTGADINPDMIAVARRVSDPSIDFVVAPATDLPFTSRSFDVVVCQQAVQFFEARVAALAEIRRVTDVEGRLAFSVFRSLEHNPVYATFAAVLGRHAGSGAETMMGSPFSLGEEDELRRGALEAGWREVEIRIAVGSERFPSIAEFIDHEAASSPLAGPLGALGSDQRQAMQDELERELAAYLVGDSLTFPNETYIVTAMR